jgi:hypothetical protein
MRDGRWPALPRARIVALVAFVIAVLAADARAQLTTGLQLSTFAPAWNGFRPSLPLAAAQQDAPLGGSVLQSQGVIRLGYHRAASGAWIGGGWGTAELTGRRRRDATLFPGSPPAAPSVRSATTPSRCAAG